MARFDHVLIEQSTVASSRSSVTPGDALPHALPVGSARCRHPLTGARHPFYCLLLSVARGWVSVSMETHSISAPCGLHPWSDVLVGARLLPLASRVTATTAFMLTAATPPLLSVLPGRVSRQEFPGQKAQPWLLSSLGCVPVTVRGRAEILQPFGSREPPMQEPILKTGGLKF